MNFRPDAVATGLCLVVLCAGCSTMPAPDPAPDVAVHYPETRTTNQVDVLHGVSVADPYRWLEDDNSPETAAWVKAENAVTSAYLDNIPERAAITERLTQLWNYERWGLPRRKGDRYFVSRNDGLQNQAVFYVMEGLDAPPRVLLDPNKMSADGTVALAGVSITDDGKWLAYESAAAGSDWEEIRIREVLSNDELPEVIKWVKFSSASWTKDGKGFFYSRYDEPTDAEKLSRANYFHKLCYHKLWTAQSEDVVVYERPDHKDWNFNGEVTDDGRYLVITSSQGTSPKTRMLYRDLSKPDAPVRELLMDFDAAYDFVGNDGPVFYFRTDLNAPRYRLIAIDITNPARDQWRELIPESDATLTGVSHVGGKFIAQYLRDAQSQVNIFDTDGKLAQALELPGIGSAENGSVLYIDKSLHMATPLAQSDAPRLFRMKWGPRPLLAY